MHKRLTLWNQLVELDHRYDDKREAVVAPWITMPGSFDYFEAERRKAKEQGDEIRLGELSKQEKEWKRQRRETFKLESVKEQLKVLDQEEYEEARTLWLASTLYWVNHEEVKLAWQQARKKPGQLRFHSWRNENGKLSVRWQTGLPASEAFGGQSLLFCLTPVSEAAYLSPIRSERRKAARSVVSIRIASENRQPVWLTLPCVLHRPLPADGLIRSASVIRERIGTKYRWKLIVLVESASSAEHRKCGSGTVAFKISWRIRPGGLRVAYWQDDRGQGGEYALPAEWRQAMEKVKDLGAIRKQHFNAFLEIFKAWLAKYKGPEWLQETTTSVGQWRSEGRLHSVVYALRKTRFDGDENLFAQLEDWHKRDRHLGEYEVNLRDQAITWRREEYRIFAAALAQRYERVITEHFNLSRIAQKTEDVADRIRYQRILSAPSILRQAISNAIRREGGEYIELKLGDGHNCPVCEQPEDQKQKGELEQRCLVCNSVYDRDRARVVGLLTEYLNMKGEKDDGKEQKSA